MVRRLIFSRFEFEVAVIYEYFEYLRLFFNDLFIRLGVYLFYGESDIMSFYIGKSVNIRSRVFFYLRISDEVVMLR